jgi:hypothetical protein
MPRGVALGGAAVRANGGTSRECSSPLPSYDGKIAERALSTSSSGSGFNGVSRMLVYE